jgi:hypothetical protein
MGQHQAPDDPVARTGDLSTDVLARHAEAIRASLRRTFQDLVEIGSHLTEVRELFAPSDWKAWLEKEFGWSRQTADNLMNLYEMAANCQRVGNLSLNLPLRSLYLLAQPSTPEEAREEIIDRVESGEELSHTEVKETVTEAKLKEGHKQVTRLKKFYGDPASHSQPEIQHDLIKLAMGVVRQMNHPTKFEFARQFSRAYREDAK